MHSTMKRMKNANFPYVREWSEIKTEKNPIIPFNEIEKFRDGAFLENGKNICFIGNPGTGKTHCLVAIGRELCRKGITVKFITACDLVTKMLEARKNNNLTKLMEQLMKPRLLIIDELGFIPFSEDGARLLFDVFSKRYERGSIAVSTNLSFEKWTQIFGSIELTTALIDRFTHRAEILVFDGQSVRYMDAKAKLKKESGKKVA